MRSPRVTIWKAACGWRKNGSFGEDLPKGHVLGNNPCSKLVVKVCRRKKNTVILYTFYKGQLPLSFSFLFFSLSRIDLPGVSQKRPLHLTLTTLVGRAPCPQKTRNDCKWRMLFNFDVLPGCGPKMQSPPPTVPPSYPIISGFMANK